jgi:prophage DNA circulation protein
LTETHEALRANSDALLRDLDVLGTLEEEKRTISPTDPRMLDLASRIEEIALRVLAGSANERELSEQVAEHATSADVPPIDDTPRSMAAVLAEWREAERDVSDAIAGSAEALEARTRMEQARSAYQRAYKATKAAQQDEPS